MASLKISEDIEYNPHTRVIETIKDPIDVNTYDDQVTYWTRMYNNGKIDFWALKT